MSVDTNTELMSTQNQLLSPYTITAFTAHAASRTRMMFSTGTNSAIGKSVRVGTRSVVIVPFSV